LHSAGSLAVTSLPRLLIIFGQEAISDFIKCRHLGQREFGIFRRSPVFMWCTRNKDRRVDVLGATNGFLIMRLRLYRFRRGIRLKISFRIFPFESDKICLFGIQPLFSSTSDLESASILQDGEMLHLDKIITGMDKALRVVTGVAAASRPSPASRAMDGVLNDADRRHSAGLMRVNHVGEVCAQALYDSQARFARTEAMKQQFFQAAREEEDHLAWTAQRLQELGSRASILNPLWYAGAFALGTIAARLGDAQSLGFVVETERQVEAHLASHMKKLPHQDTKSRAIVEQMCTDEAAHGATARAMGAADTPAPVQAAMRAMAKVMTTTAYYL
jgi:ubiquinone biosynthesis monooxygenase Coq7